MAEKRPTILQIIPELDTGGAERTTVEMAEAIVKAGGRAMVLAEGGRLCREVEAAGAEMIHFPAATKNPLRMYANAAALTHLICNAGVDLVHARSRAPAWSAYIAARRARAHFVTTYHGIYNEKGPLKRRYNSVMARGDIIIANSGFTANVVRERYGIDPSKIVVVNRGVDIERFDRAQVTVERINALRDAWGVSPGQRVVLHPARLTRWKGQSVVINAAAQLTRGWDFSDVMFILAGDAQGRGYYIQELEKLIKTGRLKDRVRLVGHVADMPAAFALSDIVLIASTEPEAFGRTSVEAQAMGVPVIASAIGAPPFTVLAPPTCDASAATGRHVPPDDPDALAQAISEVLMLMLKPAERAAMAARAQTNARENFTTHQLQSKTLAVYDLLLGSDLAKRFAHYEPTRFRS
ncbi:MAG: glycosyltransferase family 4 protein [Hyphomicrobiaceae bacterium]